MGFEPHSVVSSALKPASLTPAEGASTLARSPRKGLTPFGIPTAVGSILFYPVPHVSRITTHASRLLERAMGFEPTTASLEGWNSTTELRPPFSSSALSFSLVQVVYVRSALACIILWWAGKDSNLGSRWQQIYSLPPLATWVPARNTLHATRNNKSGILITAFLFHQHDEKRKASRSTHGSPSLIE